jgi:hypothetical protein
VTNHYACKTTLEWAEFLFNHPPLHENAMAAALDIIVRQQTEAEIAKLRAELEAAAKLLRDVYNRGIQHNVVWSMAPCALELGTNTELGKLKCSCGVWELDARIAAFLEHNDPAPSQGGGSAGRKPA